MLMVGKRVIVKALQIVITLTLQYGIYQEMNLTQSINTKHTNYVIC